MRSCPLYYQTLDDYCKDTNSIPIVASCKHLLLITDNNKAVICHYSHINDLFQFDGFKTYNSVEEATEVIIQLIKESL